MHTSTVKYFLQVLQKFKQKKNICYSGPVKSEFRTRAGSSLASSGLWNVEALIGPNYKLKAFFLEFPPLFPTEQNEQTGFPRGKSGGDIEVTTLTYFFVSYFRQTGRLGSVLFFGKARLLEKKDGSERNS